MLLHLDQNLDRDSLTQFPLVEYAAEQWFEHARLEAVYDQRSALRLVWALHPAFSHKLIYITLTLAISLIGPMLYCGFSMNSTNANIANKV